MKRKSAAIAVLISTLSVQSQVKAPVLTGAEKLNMYVSHEQMREVSAYGDLHWQYLGPVNISGRCTDVEAVGPKGKSYTIWVASASSGVWKSVNEGVTF
ncbi:MAG TPA: hypothetical protein ENO20_14915, partial [Bacteroides sp.]|nr:hypothetical protein [Bacteroides sp.]